MSPRILLLSRILHGLVEALTLLLMITLTISCATAQRKYPEFERKGCSSYQTCQIKNGLHIAVTPLLDRERVEHYFGTDLVSKGVLPVFIAIENHSDSSTFVFFTDKIKSQSSVANAKALVYQEEHIDLPSTFLLSGLIGVGVAMSINQMDLGPTQQSASIQKNISTKAIRNETLTPGDSQSGFIFLTIRKRIREVNALIVTMSLSDINSGQETEFSFKLYKGKHL